MADNFYGVTDTGKMRDNNEDNFIAQAIAGGKYVAGCVIDGVGGYEGGEVAASLTRSAILNTLKKNTDDIIHQLKNALAAANKKIFEKKQATGENMQMACVVTLALADIEANKFYYAHVGDTRLYLFRDDSLVKVTHDHSFVGFLEDTGRLTEEAAMQHPKRNEINKALGFDEQKIADSDYIETGESPFLPGDILLLCSDGLSDMLDSRTITGIISAPGTVKEKCKELINAANLAGGKDNITVVVIQNNKSPLQQEATKPVIKKNEPVQQTTIQKEEVRNEGIEYNKRSGGMGVRFLAVLCFILLIALSWFVYKEYFKPSETIQPVTVTMPDNRNEQVRILSDSLQAAGKELLLSNIFGRIQSVTINDTLLIEKDSLHIIGNGIILAADSNYRGPAIIISPACKYVLLDSITFENFRTAIIVNSKVLHFKNVRFEHCKISVLYGIQLPEDQYISGSFSDSTLLKTEPPKTIITK